jgi:hypothetical protein
MTRKGGWKRVGFRGRCYVDARGNAISADDELQRIVRS